MICIIINGSHCLRMCKYVVSNSLQVYHYKMSDILILAGDDQELQ